MERAMEEGDCLSQEEESTWNDDLDISQLCRICANPNEYLIPIFKGEGQEHELELKITKHLPIKVAENDELPTKLCYQCASTLIAWHDMVEGCMEADEKLKAITNYKTVNNTKVTSESIAKETGIKNLSDPQANDIPLTKLNNVVHITQVQDLRSVTSVDTEEVVFEEEIASVKPEIPEMMEDETAESRCLSFRNYTKAICALKEKLMNRKIKQPKHTRHIITTSGTETPLPDQKPIPNPIEFKEVEDANIYEILDKRKHQCNSCDRVFTRSYDLKRHSLIHLDENIFETVGNSDIDSSSEKQHSESVNKSSITYTCVVCSRGFKFKHSYERHFRIHTNEKPFRCKECGKCFRYSGALTRHTREVHDKIRNYQCDQCKKWFLNRATLQDHYRMHTGERPFVCHQCGVMFKSRAALCQHSKTHTSHMPHGCIYCGKRFRRKQELINHLPIHTNEKSHICDKCGKAFSTRGDLVRHFTVHSDDKPFTCAFCNLRFSQKRYVKSHMKSRHGRSEELPPTGAIPVDRF